MVSSRVIDSRGKTATYTSTLTIEKQSDHGSRVPLKSLTVGCCQ
jgi:hypothetical protein